MSIIANVKRQMVHGILNCDVKDDVPILGHNTEKKFACGNDSKSRGISMTDYKEIAGHSVRAFIFEHLGIQ